MVGRGLGLLRGTHSGWCVRCSPGSESLENGGLADSQRQWLGPLTTAPGRSRMSQGAFGTYAFELGRLTSHRNLLPSNLILLLFSHTEKGRFLVFTRVFAFRVRVCIANPSARLVSVVSVTLSWLDQKAIK